MTQIEKLLPQRYPFLFVDQIAAVSLDEIVGINTYTSDFLYFQEYISGEKTVPAAILLESLVQCGGAGLTALGAFGKACWGLAAIEKAVVLAQVPLNAETRMVISTGKVTGKVIKQSGITFCQGKKVLEAAWLCLRLPD